VRDIETSLETLNYWMRITHHTRHNEQGRRPTQKSPIRFPTGNT